MKYFFERLHVLVYKYTPRYVLTFQIVLITLEFERKMLSINSQTVHTACVDGEISVIASANMQLVTRTGGGGEGHGLSVFDDLACVALDKSLCLLLEGVDRFFDRKICGEKHNAHGGIGILPVDLLHRPGVGGIVDTKDARPLEGGESRLGLEEGSEDKRGERRELHNYKGTKDQIRRIVETTEKEKVMRLWLILLLQHAAAVPEDVRCGCPAGLCFQQKSLLASRLACKRATPTD